MPDEVGKSITLRGGHDRSEHGHRQLTDGALRAPPRSPRESGRADRSGQTIAKDLFQTQVAEQESRRATHLHSAASRRPANIGPGPVPPAQVRDEETSVSLNFGTGIDLGFFRPGGEEYAEGNDTFGPATIRRDYVTCRRGEISFDYVGKGSQRREHAIADAQTRSVVRALKAWRWGGQELLAYRTGSRVHDVTAAEIKRLRPGDIRADFTVKDFRTWHATVLAAVGLAVPAAPDSGRKRAAARVTQEVAGYLGNTPAVARSAYIDPVVFARYQAGKTIVQVLDQLGASAECGELATQGDAEAAVLKLLKKQA